jgi:sugar phosphate isomerase/epimerase
MPKLAAFPKAYMKSLCKDGTMVLAEWITLAAQLDIEGLEWYAGFIEMADKKKWSEFRSRVEDTGKVIPMLCCSPDFTHPDEDFRRTQVEQQKHWIDMAYSLGAGYCRVLSGQRRPSLSPEQGIHFASECISMCLSHAREAGVTLILENHYKDDFWEYPEFVQKADAFCALVENIVDPNFGVNFDPSNCFLAGEDPLELLRRVSHRVVTMHASDRYLTGGTLADLSKSDGAAGYASNLQHGEIGKGLNDYDAIFQHLRNAGFDGWISIEDGVSGMDQLVRSVSFLRKKMHQYWPQ